MAMAAVWDLPPDLLKPTDRFVLLAIADHVGDTTGEAWPSIERVADRTSLSHRTVQRSLRTLEARGFIEVVERGVVDPRIPADRRPNLYRWLLTPVDNPVGNPVERPRRRA